MGLKCSKICVLCKFNSLTERQRERKTRSTCFSQDEKIVNSEFSALPQVFIMHRLNFPLKKDKT